MYIMQIHKLTEWRIVQNICIILRMEATTYIAVNSPDDTPTGIGELPQCAVFSHDERTYGLRILHAGRVVFHESPHAAPDHEHRHPVYHIVLFLENQDFFQVNGQLHPARPGVLVITSPQDGHSFVPYHRHPVMYTEIAFQAIGPDGAIEIPFVELLSSLFAGRYSDPVFPISISKRHQNELCDTIQILVQELADSHKTLTARVALRLLETLNFIAEEFFTASRQVSSLRVLAPLELAKLEIRRHYNQPLAIADLAAIAGLSPNYFLTCFRKRFNITPIQYQQDLRLGRAKRLLETTDLPCQTIADEVGYSDIFFFSKIFKKAVGVPPTAYRHEHRS